MKRIITGVAAMAAVSLTLVGCGGGGGFCDAAKDFQKKYGSVDPTNKDQAKKVLPEFKKLADQAPNDSKADWQTMYDMLNKVVNGQTPNMSDASKLQSASENVKKSLKSCNINV